MWEKKKRSGFFLIGFLMVAAVVTLPQLQHTWLHLFTHSWETLQGFALSDIHQVGRCQFTAKPQDISSLFSTIYIHTIAQQPVTVQLTYFTAPKIRRNLFEPLWGVEIMYWLPVSVSIKINIKKPASLDDFPCIYFKYVSNYKQTETTELPWTEILGHYPSPCDIVKLQLFFFLFQTNERPELSWQAQSCAAHTASLYPPRTLDRRAETGRKSASVCECAQTDVCVSPN